jgi:hypothetical protein
MHARGAPEKSPASDSPLMLTTMHGASRVLLLLLVARHGSLFFFLSFA